MLGGDVGTGVGKDVGKVVLGKLCWESYVGKVMLGKLCWENIPPTPLLRPSLRGLRLEGGMFGKALSIMPRDFFIGVLYKWTIVLLCGLG
jgi:hypothetical protein